MIYWNSKDAFLCFIGGLLIGTVAGCRMLIFGKVTGISGILSGLIEFAGIFANYYLPGCFQVMVARQGMESAVFLHFGQDPFLQRVPSCNSLDVHKSGMIIAACIATCLTVTGVAVAVRASIGGNASFDNSKPVIFIAAVLFELLFGASFGLALAVSNMTRLSATISFLDVRILNPALAFVMIAAISVTMFAYYLAGKRTFPFLDSKFYRPVGSIVDAKLFLGEVLFGVGWGLAGACPGPAITNLGSGSVIPVVYFGSIVAGMWMQHLCNPFLTKALEKIIFFGQQQPSAAPDKDLHRKIV
eukprot:gene24864-33353_t